MNRVGETTGKIGVKKQSTGFFSACSIGIDKKRQLSAELICSILTTDHSLGTECSKKTARCPRKREGCYGNAILSLKKETGQEDQIQ